MKEIVGIIAIIVALIGFLVIITCNIIIEKDAKRVNQKRIEYFENEIRCSLEALETLKKSISYNKSSENKKRSERKNKKGGDNPSA